MLSLCWHLSYTNLCRGSHIRDSKASAHISTTLAVDIGKLFEAPAMTVHGVSIPLLALMMLAPLVFADGYTEKKLKKNNHYHPLCPSRCRSP